MRLLGIAFCVLAFAKAYSQQPQPTDSTAVSVPEIEKTADSTLVEQKQTPIDVVKTFFKHFHARDTTALKDQMATDIRLTSLTVKGGVNKLSVSTPEGFLNGLARIPDSLSFEERLIEVSTSGDKYMATVTTTYEFYVEKILRHIGTNQFTLFFIDDKWKIVGLADTRIYGY